MQQTNPTLQASLGAIISLADPKVIIASPDADFRSQIHTILQSMHWPAEEAVGGADALNKIEGKHEIQAVLLDHWLPDLDVSDLEHSLRTRFPMMDVVLVDLESADPSHSNRAPIHSRTEELFRALRKKPGAAKGTPKFPDAVIPPQQMPDPVASAQKEIDSEPLPGMIGSGKQMSEVSRLVRLVAPRKSTVLITGETGTGKEVVAQALHNLSTRADRPLVIVNCAAIPEALLESELFGYSRGAFTGAMQPKMGRVQAADGGTLFLDEVGELPAALQAKLLRFLQEGEVQRLGSNEVAKVDVRVVAATNVDLVHASSDRNKPFRQDLYYRLAVFPIALPPLRERAEDVLALASHFLTTLCNADRVALKHLDAAVQRRLLQHPWPGNVRELQHAIERAFILSQNESVLTLEHLPSLSSSPNSQGILNFS